MGSKRKAEGLRVLIRMIFLAKRAVGLFYLSIRGRFFDVEEFVEIFGAEGEGEEAREEER